MQTLNTTIRRANVVGMARVIGGLPVAALRVKSWDDQHSPATQNVVEAYCRANGLLTERVFDAAHGRRYLLFVYPRDDEAMRLAARRACFDHLTGG